ncbi:MAG: TolC family protein [Bacteroides sp.]|nr:TolC family protein [Bacteroides sp.]
MRKFKLFLFLTMLNTTLFSFAQNLRLMSIQEMFELADANSHSIRTFDIAEQEAAQAIKIAKNALLPSIGISFSASYLGDARITDRNFSNGENAPMPHYGNNLALEASQVIYAGGAIRSRIEMAKLGHQLARLSKENNRQDIRFLLVANYLEMYKLQNQVRVYEKNVEQTHQLLEEITAKESQGVALKNDITRYELQLRSLELALTQLRNGITILNHELVTVLGLPENTVVEVDPTLLSDLPPIPAEQQWQERAIALSPVLQQAKLGIEQSRYQEKVVKAERLPTLALIAGEYLDGPITFEVPPINKNINYWFVGVGLTFNIASTSKSGKEVKLAKLSTRRATESELLTREQVHTGVKEAYIRFCEAFTVYHTQLKSLELAHQNYAVINNRYLHELALLTDMLDASNAQLSAELQVVNARINILFHYYKLQRVTGNP